MVPVKLLMYLRTLFYFYFQWGGQGAQLMQLLSKVKAECETTTSKPRDPWPYTVSSPRSHGIRMALETTKFELFIGRASTAKNIYIYIYIYI
jgi:hypothetical protein